MYQVMDNIVILHSLEEVSNVFRISAVLSDIRKKISKEVLLIFLIYNTILYDQDFFLFYENSTFRLHN